jgi:hypothetical protein
MSTILFSTRALLISIIEVVNIRTSFARSFTFLTRPINLVTLTY